MHMIISNMALLRGGGTFSSLVYISASFAKSVSDDIVCHLDTNYLKNLHHILVMGR